MYDESQSHQASPRKGRGATANPAGRFEAIAYALDPDASPDPDPDNPESAPETRYFRDRAQSLITTNSSPDVPFEASLNPYRGCEHGCVYCYARPGHEFLGLSAGLDFERVIFVKENAPALLQAELAKPSWRPKVLAMSGVTDCYQPVERRLRITRGCLEVLRDFRNPVGIITKNSLVTRDKDLLAEMAEQHLAAVMLSITTLDPELARRLEPRAAAPHARLRAIRELTDAGVPVGVMTAPIIPGLNDEEIPAILQAAAEHGARFAGYVMLRLPHGLADLFEDWLRTHYPNRHARVMDRLRHLRDGERSSSKWGERMRGSGPFADLVAQLHHSARTRYGLDRPQPTLSTQHFRRHDPQQPTLF